MCVIQCSFLLINATLYNIYTHRCTHALPGIIFTSIRIIRQRWDMNVGEGVIGRSHSDTCQKYSFILQGGHTCGCNNIYTYQHNQAKWGICMGGGTDRNICYINIVGRSHSDNSQKYLDVSDFFKKIFLILKNRVFSILFLDLKETSDN